MIKFIGVISGLTFAAISGILATQSSQPLPLFVAIPAMIGGIGTAILSILHKG